MSDEGYTTGDVVIITGIVVAAIFLVFVFIGWDLIVVRFGEFCQSSHIAMCANWSSSK